MLHYRNSGRMQPLHALIVESDPVELNRACLRLLAQGCSVSTCQIADCWLDAAERMQPDLILLDLLMPGMDIVALQARCRSNRPLAVILHTKINYWVLRAVLDLKDFAGVIRKTADDQVFHEAFHAVRDELDARELKLSASYPSSPAVSGTHRINVPRDLAGNILPPVRLVRRA